MLIELHVLKAGKPVFAYAFTVQDKSEIPGYLQKAVSAFYKDMPELSLLDPEVTLKLDAPMNKNTPSYA
jgi:hypothetical protein